MTQAGLVFLPSAAFSVIGNIVSGTLSKCFGPRVPAVLGLLSMVASVPSGQAGTASAVFNTCRQVGGAVAIAVFGALIADRGTFVRGMQISSTITASLLFLAAMARLFLRPPAASAV